MSRLCLTIAASLLLGVLTGPAQANSCHHPEVLRVGIVPQMNLQEGLHHYESLLRALAEELDSRVELVSAGSYGAVVEGVVDGSIHLAELGPGAYLRARERGAPIAAFASLHPEPSAQGPITYEAVLVSRKDSKFQKLEDTRGATLSLVDPYSTSGALIPRVALPRLTGQPLEQWFKRVSYAGSHDHAIAAVLNGRVDTAFVSSARTEELEHEGRPTSDYLRVLWRSEPIPSDPFVYQTYLCQATKAAIEKVFFERADKLQGFLRWRRHGGFVPVTDAHYEGLLAGR